jgi:hypothetical protein
MDRGFAEVVDSLPAFFVVGLSWQHLWWSDEERTRSSRRKIIESRGSRWSDRCPRCETVVVYSNKEPRELNTSE